MLTFQEEGHIYKLDDVVIPSVTQILKETGMVNLDRIPKHILNKAAEKGVNVHYMLDLYDNRTLEDGQPDYLLPYLDGYKKFLDEYKPEIEAVEQIFYGFPIDRPSLTYGCRIDRVYTIDGVRWIVDFKTGGKYKSTRLQTAAYLCAYNEYTHAISFDHEEIKDFAIMRGALYLDGEGGFDFVEHTDEDDIETWMNLVKQYYWRKEK